MKQLSLDFGDNIQRSPKSYKGIYAMHKYWSKKPSDLVSHYICRYSRPGDIVLDPFCGSGVTVIESVRMRRRALGFDINPIAIFVTRMGLEHVDVGKVLRAYERIEANVKSKIEELYRSVCPKCANVDAMATHYIWEHEVITEVWVSCENCRTRKVTKHPDHLDYKVVESLGPPSDWYPQDFLFENSRINAKHGMKISDLFSNRALHALSLLLSEIQSIEDTKVRNTLRLCFSAALPQTSRMVFVIKRRGKNTDAVGKLKTEVGSWVIGYWIPSEHFEINVWRCFCNRLKRVTKGKREIAVEIPDSLSMSLSVDSVSKKDDGYFVDIGNATCLPVESESIDYVFTDPPHGNRIPYLELSLMWNSWLGLADIDWRNEIVISGAKARKKDSRDYRDRVSAAIREIWRVLKPEKCMSIAFNSLDDKTWLTLLNSCMQAGFHLLEIQPLNYSATSVVQDNRKNALKTDFVLTFRKQLPALRGELYVSRNVQETKNIIYEYLASHSDRRAQTYLILNHVIVMQAKRGRFSSISMILDVLDRNFKFNDSAWQL